MQPRGVITYLLVASAAICKANWSHGAQIQYESAQRITDTASQFVASRHPWQGEKVTVTVGDLDPRTRLPRCSQALQAFLPPGASIKRRSTIGVRCGAKKPWKIYLPVTLASFAKVMVSKHPIAAGQLLSPADISWTERDVSTLAYGYQRSLDKHGMRSRRSIPQGAVITANMLEAAAIIRKGQTVDLVSRHSAVKVSMKGRALEDGAKGSRIRLANLSSGKQVEGRVDSRHRVIIE